MPSAPLSLQITTRTSSSCTYVAWESHVLVWVMDTSDGCMGMPAGLLCGLLHDMLRGMLHRIWRDIQVFLLFAECHGTHRPSMVGLHWVNSKSSRLQSTAMAPTTLCCTPAASPTYVRPGGVCMSMSMSALMPIHKTTHVSIHVSIHVCTRGCTPALQHLSCNTCLATPALQHLSCSTCLCTYSFAHVLHHPQVVCLPL